MVVTSFTQQSVITAQVHGDEGCPCQIRKSNPQGKGRIRQAGHRIEFLQSRLGNHQEQGPRLKHSSSVQVLLRLPETSHSSLTQVFLTDQLDPRSPSCRQSEPLEDQEESLAVPVSHLCTRDTRKHWCLYTHHQLSPTLSNLSHWEWPTLGSLSGHQRVPWRAASPHSQTSFLCSQASSGRNVPRFLLFYRADHASTEPKQSLRKKLCTTEEYPIKLPSGGACTGLSPSLAAKGESMFKWEHINFWSSTPAFK